MFGQLLLPQQYHGNVSQVIPREQSLWHVVILIKFTLQLIRVFHGLQGTQAEYGVV
jgi:hypothetical protein